MISIIEHLNKKELYRARSKQEHVKEVLNKDIEVVGISSKMVETNLNGEKVMVSLIYKDKDGSLAAVYSTAKSFLSQIEDLIDCFEEDIPLGLTIRIKMLESQAGKNFYKIEII